MQNLSLLSLSFFKKKKKEKRKKKKEKRENVCVSPPSSLLYSIEK